MMDPVDVRILARLQEDGRITKHQLAKLVKLSPSACRQRMTRLAQHGYIRGYHAEVELERIVRTDLVIVQFTLGGHREQDIARFERAMQGTPEVTECLAVGTRVDYIATFTVTGVAHFREVAEKLLRSNLGIQKFSSYIATKTIKRPVAPPVERLLERLRQETARKQGGPGES